MLLKSKISQHQLSLDPALNDAYYQAKLGKFTSSEFHYLMGVKGIGEGGLSYIYRKVGEVLSGRPARPDISTAATEHGLTHEREGLTVFGKKMELESMLVQRLILDEDGVSGGTPDGLIVLNESTDGLSLNVKSCEIKCPITFDGYIRLWKCKTPNELKEECRAFYFQVLHQMMICDCLSGYFIVYQPFFQQGQMRIIEFKKIDLIADFKLMAERKAQAINIFETTLNEMKNS
jgi:hypothetical protein